MADKESRNWKPKSDLELDDNQKLGPCWKAGDQMASKLNSSIQRRVDDNLLELFQQNGRNEPKPMLLRSPSLQKKSSKLLQKPLDLSTWVNVNVKTQESIMSIRARASWADVGDVGVIWHKHANENYMPHTNRDTEQTWARVSEDEKCSYGRDGSVVKSIDSFSFQPPHGS